MLGFTRSGKMGLFGLLVLATGAVFAIDLQVPLGKAVWLAYFLCIPVVLALKHRFAVPGFATVTSIMVVVGYFLSPTGGDAMAGALDRSLGIAVLWTLVGVQLLAARSWQLGLKTDLLEQLVAERTRALRENETWLRLFIEYAPVALALFDRNMRYLGVSRRWRTDYGLGEANLLGRSHYEVFPEISAEWKAVHQRALAGEVVRAERDCFVRASGATHWLRWEVRPCHDDGGEVCGIVVFTEDITERVNAEEALRVREGRLTSLLNTVSDAILTIDEGGVIQSANPATERLFGYTEDELLGQNVALLMPSPHREEHDGYIARYLRTGEARIIGKGREALALRKDGSVFPIDLAVSRAESLGLFTGIVRDATWRKQLEREVIEVAALEQRRIGQNLHDDVGQELTALGLLADGLAGSLEGVSPAQAAIAQKVGQGVRRLLRQVRGIARGLAHPEVAPAGLPAALAELAGRLGETSGLRCSYLGDEAVVIRDSLTATHLYHIAQEACTNALKHAQARSVEIRLGAEDESLVLEVRDDGVGLPADASEGLGLRIMRNRAGLIGAQLSVTAARTRGTAVTCVLSKENVRGHNPR